MVPKSCNNCLIQSNSLVVAAKARYSASADEREMVDCLLDFHDTKESLRKTQTPETDLHESGQEAQSASEKAVSFKEEREEKKGPCPGLDLR